MSTIIMDFATVPNRKLRWSEFRHTIDEWRRRARSRRELANLSQMDLLDIGICPSDASREVYKPFWMA